jgi:hypothetical protein
MQKEVPKQPLLLQIKSVTKFSKSLKITFFFIYYIPKLIASGKYSILE